jgi:hypothetical protein
VHQKFSAVHQKFSAVHQKFSAVHQKFSAVHQKFNALFWLSFKNDTGVHEVDVTKKMKSSIKN